jgi:hypothetical protein
MRRRGKVRYLLFGRKVPHSSQFPWNGIKSFFPSPSIHPTLNPAGVDGRTEALTSIIIQGPGPGRRQHGDTAAPHLAHLCLSPKQAFSGNTNPDQLGTLVRGLKSFDQTQVLSPYCNLLTPRALPTLAAKLRTKQLAMEARVAGQC